MESTADSIFTYFLLSGVIHAVYLCLILVTSKSRFGYSWLLAIILGAFALYLFNVWVFRSGFEILNAYLSGTSMPFLYLAGPAYWLYIMFVTGAKDKWGKLDFIHLLPAIICFLAASPYYFMDCKIKLEHIAMMKNSDMDLPVQRGFYFGGHILQTLFYLFLSFGRVNSFIQSVKRQTREFKMIKRWITETYIFMVALALIYTISFIGFIFFRDARWFFNNVFNFSITVFIHWVGFLIIRESPILSAATTGATPEAQGPTEDDGLREKIEQLMTEQPYLDPEYSLRRFSEQLNTNTVYASRMVNLIFNKSFTDLINEFRVEEAKSRLRSENEEKMMAVALESGFSNKQTFARVFKKHTGLTPSEYREKQK